MNTATRFCARDEGHTAFWANLGYLIADRPLIERIDAAAASGFKAIELQFPYDVPASQVKAAIVRNRLTVLGINTSPGTREANSGSPPFPAASASSMNRSPGRSITSPRSAAAGPLSRRQGRALAAAGGGASTSTTCGALPISPPPRASVC